jgi:hypothetical protein
LAHEHAQVNRYHGLRSITNECGGILMAEGSHQFGALGHKQRVFCGKHVECGPRMKQQWDHRPPMELGGALSFGPDLLHHTHLKT